MPRINPRVCLECLEELHAMTLYAWELSKNQELTDTLERVRELLERMITTIDSGVGVAG